MDLQAVAARAQHGALDGRGRRRSGCRAAAPRRLRRGPGSAGAGCSVALALLTLRWSWSSARSPGRRPGAGSTALREALRAIARREVLRWLLLVELADLLLDVFLAFLALYLVDDVGRVGDDRRARRRDLDRRRAARLGRR